MKTLIAFFSMTGESYVAGKLVNLEVGNTHVAADIIQEIIDADKFQIKTIQDYPQGHMNLIQVAKEEQFRQARPALTNKVEFMEQYDTIILGYPNWWETCPMPVFTFLESYDFTGKTILPFCTHEGSGLANSIKDICRVCPNANILEGLAISGAKVREAKPILRKWLEKSKMIESEE